LKSPDELARALARQWEDASKREQLVLHSNTWPVEVPIGRPTAARFTHETTMVRAHVEAWRAIEAGQVRTESMRFRSAAEPVEIPVAWALASAAEWVDATGNAGIAQEHAQLSQLLDGSPTLFHRLLVRQRSLWRARSTAEVLQAVDLALALEPGIAAGRPLRSIALVGIDSKFIERHTALVTALLDARFDGRASRLGLVGFLEAADEGDHWLLVVPLDPGLLPFQRQRVRTTELMDVPLPASRIVLVENERCVHLMPPLTDTIAILGAGLNLGWLSAPWLRERQVGYWGDMDTWGLTMLANARQQLPRLTPLLMDQSLFDCWASRFAVPEDSPAALEPPNALTPSEQALYRHLLAQPKGRLEQEFLPEAVVADAFAHVWL
jgi:hypothetical protein